MIAFRLRLALFVLALPAPFLRPNVRAAPSGEVVKLPPFVVEERLRGPHWRYARLPGFEVLARCPDQKAHALAYSYYRAHQLQSVLLPPKFLARFDVPTKLIFFDDTLWDAALENATALLITTPFVSGVRERPAAGAPTPFEQMRQDEPEFAVAPIYRSARSTETTVTSKKPTFLKDIRLSDDDAVVIFNVVPSEPDTYYRTYLKSTYLAQLLSMRTPTLPAWFVSGFLEMYQQLSFAEDTITLAPFLFIDADRTAAARLDPFGTTRTWLPLLDLFAEDSATPATWSVETRQIAAAERQLFIRWALDPRSGGKSEALWRLVEDGCHQPITEAVFTRAFGTPSTQLADVLADYFAEALRRRVVWHAQAIASPSFEFEDATVSQSARIRGDWERLEAIQVRDVAPDFAPKYRTKAHETLEHAYHRGENDPPLLAVLGLAELDGGDSVLARDLLERAVHASVVRPKAYAELARLQLGDALAHPAANGKLSPDQSRPILDLLHAATRQSPQMPAVYRTCLALWENGDASPASADIALLLQGTDAFPRSAELNYRAAKILLAVGRKADAFALVERAVQLGANDAYSRPLRDLLDSLAPEPHAPSNAGATAASRN